MPFPNFARISPEEEAQAVALYRRGWSQQEVAEKIGRSRRAVRNALDRAGVRPRSPERTKAAQRSRERDRLRSARRRATERRATVPPLRSVFDLARLAA